MTGGLDFLVVLSSLGVDMTVLRGFKQGIARQSSTALCISVSDLVQADLWFGSSQNVAVSLGFL